MEIELPAVPLGIMTLIGFFLPYAIGAINGLLSFVQKPWQKKVVTIVVAVLLAVVTMIFYYAITGETLPSWPVFVILALMVVATSYALVTKRSANEVERAVDKNDPGTRPGASGNFNISS